MGYVLIGLAAGVISGMGIGGGTILIPALTILFAMPQQNAQHINLLYFIPTATIAIAVHKKNGNIEKQNLTKLILFGLVGALPGALLAIRVEGDTLRKGFAIFLLLMGLYEMYKGYKRYKKSKQQKGALNPHGTDPV